MPTARRREVRRTCRPNRRRDRRPRRRRPSARAARSARRRGRAAPRASASSPRPWRRAGSYRRRSRHSRARPAACGRRAPIRARRVRSSSPREPRRSAGVAPDSLAARTQGVKLASCSWRVRTTSSPGPQPSESARAICSVSEVMFGPKTTHSGSDTPRKRAKVSRLRRSSSSERTLVGKKPPVLALKSVRYSATASATEAGTWLPAGPSKKDGRLLTDGAGESGEERAAGVDVERNLQGFCHGPTILGILLSEERR